MTRNESSDIQRIVSSTPGRRASQRKGEQIRRRQELLETVARVMATRRSGTITLDELASLTSASKRTIYRHFKSKGHMLYQLQMYLYDLLTEAINPILDDKSMSPRQRLSEAVRTQVSISCNHWEVSRALSTDVALKEAPLSSSRAMARGRRAYEKKFADLIQEIGETERLSNVDAKAASLSILGFIASIARWYRGGQRLSGEQIADYAVRSVLNGFV